MRLVVSRVTISRRRVSVEADLRRRRNRENRLKNSCREKNTMNTMSTH